MDKESLEKRLIQIKQNLEQTLANYNVLIGTKHEIEYWLAELDKQASQSNIPNDTKDGENKTDEADK